MSLRPGNRPIASSDTRGSLRFLWVYSAADEWTAGWHSKLLCRRKERGYDVEGFCITPESFQRRWLPFPELDHRWRRGDPALMDLYGRLADAAARRDVLVLYNGANIHPDFARRLALMKVYTAGDDPESTNILSRPAAPAFDVHLVNNVACLDLYRGFGCRHVYFWPLGSQTFLEEADPPGNDLLDPSCRTVPAVFVGEFQRLRGGRLEQLARAFPDAFFAGNRWPRGFVTREDVSRAYWNAQLGWNIHNSTGPVNFRTYELPAHGVLQICDNQSRLPAVFEPGVEVVGFEDIKECIDRTRYYLAHPEEQRQIAHAGWERWRRDYHPDRIWESLVEIVHAHREEFLPQSAHPVPDLRDVLRGHSRKTFFPRLAHRLVCLARRVKTAILGPGEIQHGAC